LDEFKGEDAPPGVVENAHRVVEQAGVLVFGPTDRAESCVLPPVGNDTPNVIAVDGAGPVLAVTEYPAFIGHLVGDALDALLVLGIQLEDALGAVVITAPQGARCRRLLLHLTWHVLP